MKESIGFELRALSVLIRRESNRCDVARESPKMGWVIGYVYAMKDKDVYQKDIEKLSNLRRSTTTVMLQKMEQKGLIERHAVDTDARLKKITLTPKAIAMHKQVLEQIEETEKRLTEGISKEELDAFRATMKKMQQNLIKYEKANDACSKDDCED